jgi:hypothetical protein
MNAAEDEIPGSALNFSAFQAEVNYPGSCRVDSQ